MESGKKLVNQPCAGKTGAHGGGVPGAGGSQADDVPHTLGGRRFREEVGLRGVMSRGPRSQGQTAATGSGSSSLTQGEQRHGVTGRKPAGKQLRRNQEEPLEIQLFLEMSLIAG